MVYPRVVAAVIGLLAAIAYADEPARASSPPVNTEPTVYKNWEVSRVGRMVKYATHGRTIPGHEFGFVKMAGDCAKDLLWLSLSTFDVSMQKFKGTEALFNLVVDNSTFKVKPSLLSVVPMSGQWAILGFTNQILEQHLLKSLELGREVVTEIVGPRAMVDRMDNQSEIFSLNGFVASRLQAQEVCQHLSDPSPAARLSERTFSHCQGALTADTFRSFLEGPAANREALLARLPACLSGNREAQNDVDILSVDALERLSQYDDPKKKDIGQAIVTVLRIAAEAGYPSSQHNLAGMHNAPEGSHLQKAVPQDYREFLYWTRRAASQGELRSMFNLAMRLADGVPEAELARDPELAYHLITYLEESKAKQTPGSGRENFLSGVTPHLVEAKKAIEESSGPRQVQQFKDSYGRFSLERLSPVGGGRPLPTLAATPYRGALLKLIDEAKEEIAQQKLGKVIVGKVAVASGDNPEMVIFQSLILPGGDFAGPIKDLTRPVGFRMHQYAPYDLDLHDKTGEVIEVGTIIMRRLLPSELVPLAGKIVLEDLQDASRASVKLSVSQGPINTPSNGTRARPKWPQPIEVPVDSSGLIHAPGFSPGVRYYVALSAPGYVTREMHVLFQPEVGADISTITLEKTRRLAIEFMVSKQGSFQSNTKSMAVLGGGDRWKATPDIYGWDVELVQKRGQLFLRSVYAPCTIADLGKAALDDFLGIDASSATRSLDGVVLEDGHVYLLRQGHWKRNILFKVSLRNEAR